MADSDHHMLVAVDDSEASLRALSYVAGVVRDAPLFRIRLFHALPHIPTGLLEHGGYELGGASAAENADVDDLTRWRVRVERAAHELMRAGRETLEAAGVAASRIEECVAAPLPDESIGSHILHAAEDHGCDTVVVGRAPRNWLADALHRHPTHRLLGREGRGLAVWIVT